MPNPFGQHLTQEEEEVPSSSNPFGGHLEEEAPTFERGDYESAAKAENLEWDKFWHAFSKVKTISESAGDVLEQHIPMGRIQITDPDTGELDLQYIPPSDLLKEAVKSGDEEFAAEVLNSERDERLRRRFPHLYTEEGVQKPDTGNIAGTLIGAIADPTTLIPFAQGIKGAALSGAAFGAADAALFDMSEYGKIKGEHVGLGVALGAAIPTTLKVVGRGLGLSNWRESSKVANKILDKYEKNLIKNRAQGIDSDIASVNALWNSGVKGGPQELQEMYKLTGRSIPKMPTPAIAQDTLEALEQEAANSWLKQGALAVSRKVEPLIGTVSTGLRGLSPKIFQAVRKADLLSHLKVHRYTERVDGWSHKVANLQKKDVGTYNELKRALMGENFKRAYGLMYRLEGTNPAYKGMAAEFKEVRKVLDEIYEGYAKAGYKLPKQKNYFPKPVKNPEGIGVVRKSIIKNALSKAEEVKKAPLTEAETARLINSLITRGTKLESKAKVSKHVLARKYHYMDEAMLPHYAEVNDALHSYIRHAVHDIERRNFLKAHGGKGFLAKAGVADPTGRDLEKSLGELVAKESERLNLSTAKENELLRLLRARFGKGEMATSMPWQNFKNVAYGTTLGNIFSAITQLGDNAFGMYMNGVRTHLGAMFGRKAIKKTYIGLSEISEDLFTDATKSKKFLDWTLKWSGFSSLDKFGKESLLNGAMNKYRKMLNTQVGQREFVSKWGPYFGGDMPKLMKALKTNNFNDDNVRLLMWHSLADIQPIGLAEMPEKYLNHPNGRVFYMLKTFTIKQFDIMRREIFQEAAKGNTAKAAKNAANFAILFGMINGGADAFKDFISGKDVEITDSMVENLVKLVGVSRYQTSKMSTEGPMQILLETILPPVPFIDKPAQALLQGKPEKALEPIPIVGKLAARHLKE